MIKTPISWSFVWTNVQSTGTKHCGNEKTVKWRRDEWLPGLGEDVGVAMKGQREGSLRRWNVLELDCMEVGTPVVTAHCVKQAQVLLLSLLAACEVT